jgi:hypothetical protein
MKRVLIWILRAILNRRQREEVKPEVTREMAEQERVNYAAKVAYFDGWKEFAEEEREFLKDQARIPALETGAKYARSHGNP